MNKILESLLENREKAKKRREDLTKHYESQRRKAEKEEGELAARQAEREAVRARLIADLEALEVDYDKKLKRTLADREAAYDEVKSGKVQLKNFLDSWPSVEDLTRKHGEDRREALADAYGTIREVGVEIFEIKARRAQLTHEIACCFRNPILEMIRELEAEKLVLEQEQGAFDLFYTDSLKEQAAQDLRLAKGMAVAGMVWDNLSRDELRAMRHDPRIPLKYAEELEDEISKMRAGDTIDIHLSVGGLMNPGPGISFLIHEAEK
ncbi:MAG: hypothetical protein WBC70_01315 [Candidatus Aminicenantales bacterium]